MAAIKKPLLPICPERMQPQVGRIGSPILQALTSTALLLPGLMLAQPALADEDEFSYQYSHYEEGKRNLFLDQPNNIRPIAVDSLNGSANISFSDRVKLRLNFTQDTWGGATPVATAPLSANVNKPVLIGASPLINNRTVFFDRQHHIYKQTGVDENSFGLFAATPQLVHIMSVASPETRKQGDFKLSYEWDESQLDFGGGNSVERDYESRFVNLGGRLDFNQKLTSVNAGLSYTNSATNALMDHDIVSYIDNLNPAINSGLIHPIDNGGFRIKANREDWSGNLGLTQVLSKDALLKLNAGYSRGTGYMANPYKVVEAIFEVPSNSSSCGNEYFCPDNIVQGVSRAFLEKRPTVRDQWNLGAQYVQYLDMFNSALHLNYNFSFDNWGVTAHTFSGDWVQPLGEGWSITPRVRYYSQDAASFYTPFLIVNREVANGLNPDNYKYLPNYYSSDQRLSGYGALSGGISVNKQFAKGISLEAGFEYYTHEGSLKLGGGGEAGYANFDYYVVNGSLKMNLSTLGKIMEGGAESDHQAKHRHHLHGAPVPAGVMFGHMLENPGEFMLGYRYMYSSATNTMLNGSHTVADQTIVNQGCGLGIANKCYIAPNSMNMHMHMLDIMYAPTDWLNVMLMPQFVDMNMTMRRLAGAPADAAANNGAATGPGDHIIHHILTGDATGGLGDTGIYSLFKLYNEPAHKVNLTLGMTAPTGDFGIWLRRNHTVDGGFIHYGMQLGSGTWDFKPALTYTGQFGDWAWGGQVSGTKRLEARNSSGFAFGDILQTTAWGSYNLLEWLSASVRGVYTVQNAISGQYNGLLNALGPMDYTKNYGGQYWDVGFGINTIVPTGHLAGNKFSFEWLQPVSTNVNGYQLNRDGALSATWGYAF